MEEIGDIEASQYPGLVTRLVSQLSETPQAKVLVIGGRQADYGGLKHKRFEFWGDKLNGDVPKKAPANTLVVIKLRISGNLWRGIQASLSENAITVSFQLQNSFNKFIKSLRNALIQAERQAKLNSPAVLTVDTQEILPLAQASSEATLSPVVESTNDVPVVNATAPPPPLSLTEWLVSVVGAERLKTGNVGELTLFCLGEISGTDLDASATTVRQAIEDARMTLGVKPSLVPSAEAVPKTPARQSPSTVATSTAVESAKLASDETSSPVTQGQRTLTALVALVELYVDDDDPRIQLLRRLARDEQSGELNTDPAQTGHDEELVRLRTELQRAKETIKTLEPYKTLHTRYQRIADSLVHS